MTAKEVAKNQSQKIVLKVVVQGNPVDVEVNIHQPLKSIVGKTLEMASVSPGNVEWYFSDVTGNELNGDKAIVDLGLIAGTTILLNQRAGAAG